MSMLNDFILSMFKQLFYLYLFTMKKRILLVCSVCLLTAFSAFSQEQATTKHPVPPAVNAVSVLKSQAERIHEKESQLDRAATSSRAQHAQIKEELNALNRTYADLLIKEIAECSGAQRRELETELLYVEQQLTSAANH
jgi:parvulin-like peptidyl-prolyl isomerase